MSGTDFNALPVLPMPYQATDQLYVSRGNQSYRAGPDPSIIGSSASGRISWALFQIRKPAGQSGGSFWPPNQWIDRAVTYADPLNDFGAISSIPNPGLIELPAGRYCVSGWMTGMENAGMRCRLKPQMGSVSPVYGASTYSKHYSWHMPLDGLISSNEPITLMAQMRCDRDRSKSWGYGYRTHIEPEIYGSLLFFKKT